MYIQFNNVLFNSEKDISFSNLSKGQYLYLPNILQLLLIFHNF